MDILQAMIAPTVAKYSQSPPLELFSTPHGKKLHAVAGCQRASTRRSLVNDPDLVCARCMRRSALGATRADVTADALAIHTVERVARALLTTTGPSWKPRATLHSFIRLIEQFAGGTHPVATALRDLFPGGIPDTAIDLTDVGAARIAMWAPTAGLRDWARVLTGQADNATIVVDSMRAWLAVGSHPDRAITLAVAGLRSPTGITPDMLPDTLATSRADHASTFLWLTSEWETAADVARAGLADALHATVRTTLTDQVLHEPLVACGSRKWIDRAVTIAARHGLVLPAGDTVSPYGLVVCSQLVFEALKTLDRDSDLSIASDPGPAAAMAADAPEVLKIAETLRLDHPSRPWADLIGLASLVPQPI